MLIGAILIGKWVFDGQAVNDSAFPNPNFVSQSKADAEKAAVNVDLKLDVHREAVRGRAQGQHLLPGTRRPASR